MSNNTEKNSTDTKSRIEYLGWWGFLLMLAKVFAITAATVLILKYIFRVPLF